jgi:hypothetical protein
MFKYLMLLLLPIVGFSQVGLNTGLFTNVANDTIASISVPDSVYVRLPGGPWKLLTSAQNDTAWVTVDDKSAENTIVFTLANESYWTYAPSLRFQIRATGTDTITSRTISTAGLNGAFTLFIVPDTSGTNTDYSKSYITGR